MKEKFYLVKQCVNYNESEKRLEADIIMDDGTPVSAIITQLSGNNNNPKKDITETEKKLFEQLLPGLRKLAGQITAKAQLTENGKTLSQALRVQIQKHPEVQIQLDVPHVNKEGKLDHTRIFINQSGTTTSNQNIQSFQCSLKKKISYQQQIIHGQLKQINHEIKQDNFAQQLADRSKQICGNKNLIPQKNLDEVKTAITNYTNEIKKGLSRINHALQEPQFLFPSTILVPSEAIVKQQAIIQANRALMETIQNPSEQNIKALTEHTKKLPNAASNRLLHVRDALIVLTVVLVISAVFVLPASFGVAALLSMCAFVTAMMAGGTHSEGKNKHEAKAFQKTFNAFNDAGFFEKPKEEGNRCVTSSYGPYFYGV